jgi:hypothetical protein
MLTLERLHDHLDHLALTEADAVLESHLERAATEERAYSDFLCDCSRPRCRPAERATCARG